MAFSRFCAQEKGHMIMITRGKPTRKFIDARGKQRDLLSPFWFTLVADVLGRLVDKAKESSIIGGFLMEKDEMEVSSSIFCA